MTCALFPPTRFIVWDYKSNSVESVVCGLRGAECIHLQAESVSVKVWFYSNGVRVFVETCRFVSHGS